MRHKTLFITFILVVLVICSLSAQTKSLIRDRRLNEVSGIVASSVNKGLYYVHNDSGGKPEVYAIDGKGKIKAVFVLNNTINRDWEDIAIGPGPEQGRNYVYVGEIGDNRAQYSTVYLYRFAEPDLKTIPRKKRSSYLISDIDTLRFVFEDGAKDCETLFIDAVNGDVYLVSKREQTVGLYQIKEPLSKTEINTAKRILSLDFALAVGGDLSQKNNKVLIKTYEKIYLWHIPKGLSIADALSLPYAELPYETEPQGEAICWSGDGKNYLTLSEKYSDKPLYLYTYKYLKSR